MRKGLRLNALLERGTLSKRFIIIERRMISINAGWVKGWNAIYAVKKAKFLGVHTAQSSSAQYTSPQRATTVRASP